MIVCISTSELCDTRLGETFYRRLQDDLPTKVNITTFWTQSRVFRLANVSTVLDLNLASLETQSHFDKAPQALLLARLVRLDVGIIFHGVIAIAEPNIGRVRRVQKLQAVVLVIINTWRSFFGRVHDWRVHDLGVPNLGPLSAPKVAHFEVPKYGTFMAWNGSENLA